MKRPVRDALPILYFAIAKLLFHVLTNVNYGFHRDELATLDDARHLAWGFVAYPPLTPFLGRIELALFGTSLTGFRFLAAVAQSIVIVLTAAIARRLGGGRAAQWIAAIAVAISPVSLSASSLFQYVSFDFLWWVVIAYCVIRMLDDPRWWVAIGVVIGLGALTKYTIAFYIAGLVFAGRHLRSRWLWVGVAAAVIIVTPHLIWQYQHDFITLDFLKSIHERDVRIGRTANFLTDQLWIASNVVTIPLWTWGLVSLFRSRYRVLAWMSIVPFILFVIAHGRGYYLAPAYPVLIAAGAAAIPWRPIAIGFASVFLAIGSLIALIILPVAPIDSPLGRFVMKENGDLREEVGWPEMTAEVARIWSSIPAEQRSRTAIFGPNYGEAGAINLYGPRYGLPNTISAVNSFWARGYGNPPPETVIVIGSTRERLEKRYTSVELAGRIPNPHQLKNEEAEHPDIFICRGLRMPWPVYWKMIRSFG